MEIITIDITNYRTDTVEFIEDFANRAGWVLKEKIEHPLITKLIYTK